MKSKTHAFELGLNYPKLVSYSSRSVSEHLHSCLSKSVELGRLWRNRRFC